MKSARRHFLRAASALAGVAAGLPAARASARPEAEATPGSPAQDGADPLAATADTDSDYRALVCVFLRGGSDGHNWVVPLERGDYAAYRRARGPLAIERAHLLPVAPAGSGVGGRSFGMPPALAPLRTLYEEGAAAVVANIGPLARPLAREEALAGHGLPAGLLRHAEQANAWQCLSGSAGPGAWGWAGRLAERLSTLNAEPALTAIAASGDPLFLCGKSMAPVRVGAHGALAASPRAAACRQGAHDHVLAASSRLQACLERSELTPLPELPLAVPGGAGRDDRFTLAADPLARQLAAVARIAVNHAQLGVRRQIFSVSATGFDLHLDQPRVEPELLARLAHAIAWFHDTLRSLGLDRNVLLFTASEFGRTLAAERGGSGHGWGNHHVVVGGGVRGGSIVGRFPEAGLGTAEDLGAGRLLPSTSVAQLAASCGHWLGLADGELRDLLPSLTAFDAPRLPLFELAASAGGAPLPGPAGIVVAPAPSRAAPGCHA